jgi:hypothetical protein
VWSLAVADARTRAKVIVAGAVPRIVGLLGSRSEEVQCLAAGVMMNLAMDNPVMLVAADAIRPLVGLLGSSSEAVQCLAAGTLRNLVHNAESRDAVIAAGAIRLLEGLMVSGSAAVREHASLGGGCMSSRHTVHNSPA